MKRLRIAFLLLAAAAAAVSFDLWYPLSRDLRDFDPHGVARLETDMWRAYYDKRRLALFLDLAKSLRIHYGQPFLRSHLSAFYAARAAFVFKEGKSRGDYTKALPDLVTYYASILPEGDPVEKIAGIELEWWILHRERATIAPAALERSLAELQAAIYGVPAAAVERHARLRAEAMLLRDRKAEEGGVTEADWRRIGELLDESWVSLKAVVAY